MRDGSCTTPMPKEHLRCSDEAWACVCVAAAEGKETKVWSRIANVMRVKEDGDF